jgi:hypothetical protein
MAHYAFLDENNIVVQVIAGVDENITQKDENGKSVGGSSEKWESFYSSLPWFNGLVCKRTSYNGNYRKNYAGIGFTYDPVRDAFISPQPFPSWTLNEETCKWQAPYLPPQDDKAYNWNEETLSWVEVPKDI